jgi:hypothetical protein
MQTLIKNKNNEIIGLKLSQFEVTAKYYVGYGARMKRLKSIKNQYFKVLATTHERAIEIVRSKKIVREGFNSGYVLSAVKKS